MAAEVQPAKMLGTAQESDDLWIVQVPADVGEAIAATGPGSSIGAIHRIASAGGQRSVQLRLQPGIVPDDLKDLTPLTYTIRDGIPLPGRVLRFAGGTAALVGVTSTFSDAKASSSDPVFRNRQKRERLREQEKAEARQTSKLARTLASASTGAEFVGVRYADAVAEAGDAASKASAWEVTPDEAVARAAESPGGITLFSLFRHRAYFGKTRLLAALSGRGSSSSAGAKEVEAEMRAKCEYIRTGPRRGSWALSATYRGPDSFPRDEDRPLRDLFRDGHTYTRREFRSAVRAVTGRPKLAESVLKQMLAVGVLSLEAPVAAAAASPSSTSSSSAAAATAATTTEKESLAATLHLAPPSRRPQSVAELLRKWEAAGNDPLTAEEVVAALYADLTLAQSEAQLKDVCRGPIESPMDVCVLDPAKVAAWEAEQR